MFKVENADFIADKLASELLPNQEFREVLKNALEAVERRMLADGSVDGGRIEFDVDWNFLQKANRWFISCADNGDGMSRGELEKYMTTLAVQGASQNQSIYGNQGMGLKISGPTRHKNGVFIRSLKKGERTMIQVGWNGHEYGLIPVGREYELVLNAPEQSFPQFVLEQGCGTVVTFLGNETMENTFVPGNVKGWLLKYLNTRFFRLSNDRITVLVRVPSGGEEDWPRTPQEAAERMRKQGRSFNLTVVNGTAVIWDDAADRQGSDYRGVVAVQGNAAIPAANIHWWVLPSGAGTDVSSRTASGGSLAVLYQNELHDWKTSAQASPFFARLGVLFGKSRIAFVIEPVGSSITSDFARAHVLVAGVPALESDAWLLWAEQFRAEMPARIKQAMAEEQARLQTEDPERAKRIRERLKEIMQLLRPRRFKRTDKGKVKAAGPEVLGSGQGEAVLIETPRLATRPRRVTARGIGAVLSELDDQNGAPSNEVFQHLQLEPRWVTEREADDMSIVNGNANGLHDRAAALAGTDARTASVLLLNKEFRGYQAILAAANDFANPEGDDDKAVAIESAAQEWIEQKMIEAIQGLRQLENGKTWITEHYDDALSPVALTAAFMADRYHTLREVRRAIGHLREPATA